MAPSPPSSLPRSGSPATWGPHCHVLTVQQLAAELTGTSSSHSLISCIHKTVRGHHGDRGCPCGRGTGTGCAPPRAGCTLRPLLLAGRPPPPGHGGTSGQGATLSGPCAPGPRPPLGALGVARLTVASERCWVLLAEETQRSRDTQKVTATLLPAQGKTTLWVNGTGGRVQDLSESRAGVPGHGVH